MLKHFIQDVLILAVMLWSGGSIAAEMEHSHMQQQTGQHDAHAEMMQESAHEGHVNPGAAQHDMSHDPASIMQGQQQGGHHAMPHQDDKPMPANHAPALPAMGHEGMHHDMQHMQTQTMMPLSNIKKQALSRLDALPPSGTSREAGYDQRYVMEANSVDDDPASQCAKASRGLIMLDNKAWHHCGGKPAGWASGPAAGAAVMDHSQHKEMPQ